MARLGRLSDRISIVKSLVDADTTWKASTGLCRLAYLVRGLLLCTRKIFEPIDQQTQICNKLAYQRT